MKFKIEVKWIVVGFIIAGIGLSIINFINFRSLWIDEAMLALNIVEKPVKDLLQPLDYSQVAPIGFLLIEKLFASLFGNADWTMRIFPLISFIFSIFLLYKTALIILKSKLFGLYTSAFFATSFIMISYSSEVKQYMTDVAFGLAILIATIIYSEKGDKNNWWLYLLIGTLSIWFSNIAVILLFTSGSYSLYKTQYSNKNEYLRLVIVLGFWMVSFIIYYTLFIYNHPTKDVMVNYWENNGSFIPQDILSFEFYRSLYIKITSLFNLLTSTRLALLLVPIFLTGLFFLIKKKAAYFYLLVFPLILHLIISYFKLYPFDSRLILYLYPNLLIIIFSGFFFINSLFKNNQQKILYAMSLLLVANVYIIGQSGFPIEREEIKKSMSYINSKLGKGDDIYVYYGANHAFNFYKNEFDLNIKITKSSSHRNNWSNYQNPISKLNSSVWIIFSHEYWVRNEENLKESEYILNIFRDNGYKIIDQKKYKGSSVYHVIKAKYTPNINKNQGP